MTEHARRPRGAAIAEDAALIAALPIVLVAIRWRPLAIALAAAIAAALAWGFVTLHFPARVVIDDDGIAFARYGRAHRFAWRDVARLRVRRFLVRDRVLVTLSPAPAWRGRYWLVGSFDGFDALVRDLERRAAAITRARA